MRLATFVLLVSIPACSTGIKRVPDGYDPRTIPRCEPDDAAPVGDLLLAAVMIGGGIAVAVAGHDPKDGDGPPALVAGIGLGVVGAIFGLVGVAGLKWNRECRAARKQWDKRQIEQDTLVREAEARRQAGPSAPTATAPVAAPGAPRGFFCANSPSNAGAGFCVRDKAECQRTRDAAFVGVQDLTECALTERAFCFGDRCAPTVEACDAARLRVLGPDGQGHMCADSE